MRYDTPVYFRKVTPGAYDPDTGNYGADSVTETAVFAAVNDLSDERMRLMFGDIREGSLIVQLQNRYSGDFDTIRIGSKVYKADRIRNLRVKQVLTVSEVQ